MLCRPFLYRASRKDLLAFLGKQTRSKHAAFNSAISVDCLPAARLADQSLERALLKTENIQMKQRTLINVLKRAAAAIIGYDEHAASSNVAAVIRDDIWMYAFS